MHLPLPRNRTKYSMQIFGMYALSWSCDFNFIPPANTLLTVWGTKYEVLTINSKTTKLVFTLSAYGHPDMLLLM